VRQKLIDKYGKPLMRKGKEMFQGVRIAGLLEDVSGNFIAEEQAATSETTEVAEEETVVTEQPSLTLIEPNPKKAGKKK
jgi:hypothetical protein